MNVLQVGSSIEFLADSSSKQAFHYMDHFADANRRHTELEFVWICVWAKPTYDVLLWTFNNKRQIVFA